MPDDWYETWGQFASPEDLDPELDASICEGGFGWMLHHWAVIDIAYNPMFNKRYNDTLRHKREAREDAEAEGDWNTYVFLHERPYRRNAFADIASELDDAEYWDLLHSLWVDTENPWQWTDEDPWTGETIDWVRVFFVGGLDEPDYVGVFGDRPGRYEHFMDDVDKRAFDVLDDEILIYRGYIDRASPDGWSWTTDHLIGLWFSRRFANDDVTRQHLVVGKVRKDDVIAYSQGRGESEVIVDPAKVYDKQEVVLSATCECGLPLPVIERITHEQHMAKHAGAHTNKEV